MQCCFCTDYPVRSFDLEIDQSLQRGAALVWLPRGLRESLVPLPLQDQYLPPTSVSYFWLW